MTIAGQPPTDRPAATPAPLDTADGIARVMGNRALYARMLARFHHDYRHGAAPIRRAIDSGDLRLAHRIVHIVKGASGMISAPALHRQASVLELALRNGAGGQDVAIDALDVALSEVLRAIAHRLEAQPAPAAPLTAPSNVARLAELLDNGDGAAVDVLEASGADLKAALGEAQFAEVALAVNEFDFEGALRALARAANEKRN